MKLEGNKKLALTLIMLGVVISFFGGSLAYWNWESNESQKTLVSVNVQGATLTIEGGNVTHTGMYPTNDCDGPGALIGEVATATAVNGTNSDMGVILRIRASLTVKQGTLTSENKGKINWALVDTSAGTTCDTTTYKGNMANVTTNTDIDTKIRFTALAKTTTTKSYRIYVWLDSTYTHTNVGNVISDPMQDLDISVKFSPASELSQESSFSSSEPNAPVLDNGMIPIKISSDGVATTVSSTDSSWYNYEEKEWANAVLVKANGTKTRDYYKNTPGVTIAESDILAYYVWIPRYKYRMGERCSSISEPTIEEYPGCYVYSVSISKNALIDWYYNLVLEIDSNFTMFDALEDINEGFNTGFITLTVDEQSESIPLSELIGIYESSTGEDAGYSETFNGDNLFSGKIIDIAFESGNVAPAYGDAVNSYYTHPAFIWDGISVEGIWVGKFETTGDATTPTILPGSTSLTGQRISEQFPTSLKFAGGTQSGRIVTFAGNNTYGLTNMTDSHMMKTSEYGSALYLAYSQYGINGEIQMNININNITGCGAFDDTIFVSDDCQMSYGDLPFDFYPQSTTGNITGIFDLFGGSYEYVMGIHASLGVTGTSSFPSLPQEKYYDLYLYSHFVEDSLTNMTLCTLEYCGGHALNETQNWYGYISGLPEEQGPDDMSGPWMMLVNRGIETSKYGIIPWNGAGMTNLTFRSVLVID